MTLKTSFATGVWFRVKNSDFQTGPTSIPCFLHGLTQSLVHPHVRTTMYWLLSDSIVNMIGFHSPYCPPCRLLTSLFTAWKTLLAAAGQLNLNLESRAKQAHHKKAVQLYSRDDVWPSLFLQRDILVDISSGLRPFTSQARGPRRSSIIPNAATQSNLYQPHRLWHRKTLQQLLLKTPMNRAKMIHLPHPLLTPVAPPKKSVQLLQHHPLWRWMRNHMSYMLYGLRTAIAVGDPLSHIKGKLFEVCGSSVPAHLYKWLLKSHLVQKSGNARLALHLSIISSNDAAVSLP